jgi:colanic acid biosynthesis glycosyl transferase WcaI
MAHVLVLSLVFPPDSVSTAQIMGDLSADLQAAGHAVSVVTTTPHYNRDAQAEAAQPLSPIWGGLVSRSTFRGVPVWHTAMPRKSASVPRRLASWALFHVLSLVVGVVALRRVDVIIAPSPPLTIGLVAWWLGAWHRAPFIYNVQEIYPDIAINLGAVRNRWVIRALYGLERFVYRRAARVTLIAERMRQRLREKGVDAARLVVIPNFVDVDTLTAVPSPNAFTREFDLDGRFVVTYAGNLGPAQGLECLLDAAARLADRRDIVIALIGDGSLAATFAERISRERLGNVRLIPYQPLARVPEIYGASDLSVVAQAVATGADAVPSKVYRIMACGRAVLAVTDPRSDVAQLVTEAGCGFVVPHGNAEALADVIGRAADDRGALRAMGEAGRAHVRACYDRRVVTARYARLVSDVIEECRR